MNFLKKRWVAWMLCILMIVVAFGIGQAKEQKQGYIPSNAALAEEWGDENYSSYTRFVRDEVGFLSADTIRMIASCNASLDYIYNSICGIGIVDDLNGRNLEDFAYEMGYEIGLGEYDYFLLLDTASKDYWFVSGDYAGVYVDHELEIIVAEHMSEVFKDPEDGFEELFDELQEWYADHVPKASVYDENKSTVTVIGGSILFFVLIILLVLVAVISASIRTSRRFIRRHIGFSPFVFLGTHRHGPGYGVPPKHGNHFGSSAGTTKRTGHASRYSSPHKGGSSFGSTRRGSNFGGSRSGGSFGGKRS